MGVVGSRREHFVLDIFFFFYLRSTKVTLLYVQVDYRGCGKRAAGKKPDHFSSAALHSTYRRLSKVSAFCITCTSKRRQKIQSRLRHWCRRSGLFLSRYLTASLLINRMTATELVHTKPRWKSTATTIRAKSPPPACFFCSNCSSLRNANSPTRFWQFADSNDRFLTTAASLRQSEKPWLASSRSSMTGCCEHFGKSLSRILAGRSSRSTSSQSVVDCAPSYHHHYAPSR